MARIIADPTHSFYDIVSLIFRADLKEISAITALIQVEKELYSHADFIAIGAMLHAALDRRISMMQDEARAEQHRKMQTP